SKNKLVMDKSRLNELSESRFKVDQIVMNDRRSTLSGLKPRILALWEEGIKVVSCDETALIEEISWNDIDHISLQQNLLVWEMALKDKRILYFKGQSAYQLHCATDHYMCNLGRDIDSQHYLVE
ncbi:hypothetical protein SAMD00019534_033690, partial [Acytostelium subglobosum LB1]|uniref:hypothetical protein n=1 Tax=Acytostelium subglobosum LB1 TaxID=1410327 RepID=UPI000644F424